MLDAAARGRATRRAMLRWTLGSVLGLAWLPSVAAAQEAAQDTTSGVIPADGDPIWAVTTGDASLRGQPDIADNRFALRARGPRCGFSATAETGRTSSTRT